MGSKHKKQARQTREASVPKVPKTDGEEGNGYYEYHPSWRFKRISKFNGTRFGYEDKQDVIKDVLDKLANFETMTWNAIVNDKKNNHWCNVNEIINEAQKLFYSMNLGDLGQVFSLRLTGTFRVWGFINQDGTFDIFWFDPEHEIYPSKLKHT